MPMAALGHIVWFFILAHFLDGWNVYNVLFPLVVGLILRGMPISKEKILMRAILYMRVSISFDCITLHLPSACNVPVYGYWVFKWIALLALGCQQGGTMSSAQQGYLCHCRWFVFFPIASSPGIVSTAVRWLSNTWYHHHAITAYLWVSTSAK